MRRKYRRPFNAQLELEQDKFEPVILLVRSVASREEIVSGCTRAMRAGVIPGMTLAHARALLGGQSVRVFAHDTDGDRAALRAFALWATRFTPTVAPDFDHENDPTRSMPGLLADITGCERLYRGEVNLLRKMLAAVRQLGFYARIASAPTFGCAWAAARFGQGDVVIVEADRMKKMIVDLPLRGLRVDAKTETALGQVGVTTMGQVMELPRSGLASRFGPVLIRRIDQLLGEAFEVIPSVAPQSPLSVHETFNGPVKKIEAIRLATRRLLERLCHELLQRESGTRRLDVVLDRSDCEPHQIELSVSRFSRDVKHLWSLLRPMVERAHLGYGVESITLTASRAGLLPHHQHGHHVFGRMEDVSFERELAQAIDILSNRLGKRAVCRVEWTATYLPERAAGYVPATSSRGAETSEVTETPRFISRDRPSVLLLSPRPVEVMAVTPDGPLVRLRWRGDTLMILTTVGPERLTDEWWRSDSFTRATRATRDYFKAQDERGQWWWLYRELETRQWFVHGKWA